MHPATLRFVDPALERHYHDARLQYRLNAGRVSALAGVIAWLVFAVLDGVSIRDPSVALFYLRLFAAGALLVLFIVLMLATPGRWIEPLGVATLAGNIVLFVLAMAWMSEVSLPYFSPPAIFTMAAVMSFALAGMTFVEGMAIASLAFAGFLFSVTVLWPQPALAITYQFTWMLTITGFAAIGFDCDAASRFSMRISPCSMVGRSSRPLSASAQVSPCLFHEQAADAGRQITARLNRSLLQSAIKNAQKRVTTA